MGSSPKTVFTAVMPVAGLGTRFLPATKATPKEMLPVVDKPAIQYVVEEAVAAGIDDVLFVTGRSKNALENHFDYAPAIEEALASRGDAKGIKDLQNIVELAQIHYVRQGQPLGLGHAVLMARKHVGLDPFVVMLGDDLIDAKTPVLADMIAAHEQLGGSILCLMEVEPELMHLYGCAQVEPTTTDGIVRVTGVVEKPAAGKAPSNYAIIGRYLLQPDIFDILSTQEPGRSGEIQLTDAIHTLIEQDKGGGVHGVIFTGKRYDTGDKLSYLQSVISIALERDDVGPALHDWIVKKLADQI